MKSGNAFKVYMPSHILKKRSGYGYVTRRNSWLLKTVGMLTIPHGWIHHIYCLTLDKRLAAEILAVYVQNTAWYRRVNLLSCRLSF